MQNKIYCNECGTLNEMQFHHCFGCGHPIGESLYIRIHEPKTKIPTLEGISTDKEDFEHYFATINQAREGVDLK